MTDKVVTAAVVTNPPVPVVSPFDIQGKYTLPKGVGEDEQVRVGSKFTVTKTAAPSGTKVAYQWLADSAPIAKATTSAFTTTAAQAGKQIDVRLTFSKAGKTSRAVVHTFIAAARRVHDGTDRDRRSRGGRAGVPRRRGDREHAHGDGERRIQLRAGLAALHLDARGRQDEDRRRR